MSEPNLSDPQPTFSLAIPTNYIFSIHHTFAISSAQHDHSSQHQSISAFLPTPPTTYPLAHPRSLPAPRHPPRKCKLQCEPRKRTKALVEFTKEYRALIHPPTGPLPNEARVLLLNLAKLMHNDYERF